MKTSLTILTLGWAWTLIMPLHTIAEQPVDGTAAGELARPSAFLPQAGQTLHYRFSDTFTTPKESKNETGTLTLTAVSKNEITAMVAVDNKAPRNLALQVDRTGALQPADESDPSSAKTRHNGQSEPSASEQALLFRLSLAARIGADAGEEAPIPVLLNVPWARGPVNPTLYFKSTASGEFTAEASDTTSINPPQTGRPHILRSVAISTGAGILAGEIGGTTGKVIRPMVTAGSIFIASRHARFGPQPTEVTLHITGQLSDGRLQRLSASQEYTVVAQKQHRSFSDQWQIVAQ